MRLTGQPGFDTLLPRVPTQAWYAAAHSTSRSRSHRQLRRRFPSPTATGAPGSFLGARSRMASNVPRSTSSRRAACAVEMRIGVTGTVWAGVDGLRSVPEVSAGRGNCTASHAISRRPPMRMCSTDGRPSPTDLRCLFSAVRGWCFRDHGPSSQWSSGQTSVPSVTQSQRRIHPAPGFGRAAEPGNCAVRRGFSQVASVA